MPGKISNREKLNRRVHPANCEEETMKKIALIAMTAAAAIATPAMAQDVTGTINITGTVAPKCFVIGEAVGSTFTANVPMGELAQADGTLKSSSDLSATFAEKGGAALDARVLCTSATPDVSVLAEPLVNNVPAVSGYDNTVDYRADVAFSLVGGTTENVNDPSTDAVATTDTLSARLSGTGTNVRVRTSNWSASGTLVAGSYTGKITVVISPGA